MRFFNYGGIMKKRWFLIYLLMLIGFVSFAVAQDLPDSELGFVHAKALSTVKHCRAVGIENTLYQPTQERKDSGKRLPHDGRIASLALPSDKALTLAQLAPLREATFVEDITCPGWVDDKILAFFSHNGRFPKVKKITFVQSKISSNGLKLLAKFPELESLDFEYVLLDNKSLPHLMVVKGLSTLRLSGTQVTVEGISCLKRLPMLSHLELSRAQITDRGLSHLRQLKKLKSLDLSRTSINGSGLKLLGRLTDLEKLNLDNTHLDDKGVAQLAEMPNLRKLAELHVANTNITDTGCENIAKLQELQILNLSGTNLTDDGLRHLAKFPKMRHMGLGSEVSIEGIVWLGKNSRYARAFWMVVNDPAAGNVFPESPEFRASIQKEITQKELAYKNAVTDLRFAYDTPEAGKARELLKNKHPDVVQEILLIAADCHKQGNPLYGERMLQENFESNAIDVVSFHSREAMQLLITFYSLVEEESLAGRIISKGLRGVTLLHVISKDNSQIAKWLDDDSPAVRRLALGELRYALLLIKKERPEQDMVSLQYTYFNLPKKGRQRVVEMLKDPDDAVRMEAASLLWLIPTLSKNERANILSLATPQEKETRIALAMVQSLCNLSDDNFIDDLYSGRTVKGLVYIVEHTKDDQVREAALRKLAILGGVNTEAVFCLAKIINGEDRKLAAAAKQILKEFKNSPLERLRKAKVPANIRALIIDLDLQFDNDQVALASSELKRRGLDMLRPLMIAVAADTSPAFPDRAGDIIATWEKKETLLLLRPHFRDDNPNVRIAIVHAIGQMELDTIPDIVERYCNDPDYAVRIYAADAVSRLVPKADTLRRSRTTGLLFKILRKGEVDRQMTVRLTKEMEQRYVAHEGVPLLLRYLLRQDIEYASHEACISLGNIAQSEQGLPDDERKKTTWLMQSIMKTTKNEKLSEECQRQLERIEAK